jgi:hypothetical protein
METLTSLWQLTCRRPGTTEPYGLELFKVRAISAEAARATLAQRRPELEVLGVEQVSEAAPVLPRLGAMQASERRPTAA